jgi:amino acid transporter
MAATSSEAGNSSKSLRREIGIFGATMMGLGAIVGTGIFVSIGNAASVAGSWVVVAIAVAAVVACLNGLSSAQLAAAHPSRSTICGCSWGRYVDVGSSDQLSAWSFASCTGNGTQR